MRLRRCVVDIVSKTVDLLTMHELKSFVSADGIEYRYLHHLCSVHTVKSTSYKHFIIRHGIRTQALRITFPYKY